MARLVNHVLLTDAETAVVIQDTQLVVADIAMGRVQHLVQLIIVEIVLAIVVIVRALL